LGYSVTDLVDVEIPPFATDRGVKDDLQQQVTKFFFEVRRVSRFVRLLDGVKCLLCLLEQILGERGVRLLVVPGTATGGTKPLHHGDEFIKAFGHSNIRVEGVESV